jgi:hypothetical protein
MPLHSNTGREILSIIPFLLLSLVISAQILTPACSAQSGYEIRNAIVAPEYGNEEFTYSAEVWMSEDVAGETGAIAVTQFSLKLNIYNNGNEEHTDSIDQRGMSRTSFSFGPYNFKNRFAIAETENASFEFVFYAAGQVVARTKRMPGPIVKPPTITGVQFEKAPYFFQGLSAFPAIRDQESLDPKPICHLVISGPLGTSENRTWNSDDVLCRASGKSAYTASLHEDLSSYRDGGNFSFVLVYSNLKTDPITSGPYTITLRPYTPVSESLKIDKDLDYTNFTIVASVKDASASMEESNPQGRLIVSHTQKGDLSYAPSDPLISGDKVIYRWTAENDPPLFNRSDVDLSKSAPFTARLEYANDRWDFSANSSDVSFNVVEEVPKLTSQSIPGSVYVSSGQTSSQEMTATIAFSKGPGQLDVRLTGPSMDFKSTEEGIALGGNKYQYRWQVQFDDSHVNNNYTLSMSFIHDQVEGGRHDFEDKSIEVSPISVQFHDGDVDPDAGMWNGTYNYSARMDSTVPVKVQLQVYDPCSNDWISKRTVDAAVGTDMVLNWTPLRPFAYDCDEMAGKAAKYRFKASYAGEEIASSRAYNGPKFLGAKPTLISFTPVGDPLVIYVSEDGASSSISAIVGYGGGQGEATLRLTEQDGSEKIDEQSSGVPLGEDRYGYDWTVPFDWADAGKSFDLALGYDHTGLSDEEILAERTINVVPVSIFFGKANVTPDKGRWNQSYDYSLPINSSVDATVALEVYNPCSHTWVQRASGMVSSGEREFNKTAQPFRSKCTDSEGKQASFRFKATFSGKAFESDVYWGPMIIGEENKPKPGTTEAGTGEQKKEQKTNVFNDSTVTVIGNVTPAIGVIQAWDEKDPLHALTYTLELRNWTSSQVPWVELSVRANGTNQPWKIVGEKKRFIPSTGSVSWTLKPFWETPFLGLAEYRFLIDGAETQSFEGPEIIAIVSDAGDTLKGKMHDFEATVNSSVNLTVCLVGGDSSLPENIKTWTIKGQCQDYAYGSGEQPFKWTIPQTQAPPYYDFDIKFDEGAISK